MIHSLLLAPALTAVVPVQEPQPLEFRFDPPMQSAMSMTVTETHDLLLQEISTQRGDAPPVPAKVALQLRTKNEVLIAEEREAESDRIRRRFVDLAGSIQLIDPDSVDATTGEWNGDEFALTSLFKGVSVAFEPAEGQPDGYGRHYDTKELREPLLPRLAPPTDWSQFLPPAGADGTRVAKKGDSWMLTPADLEPLVAPTGFVAWRGGDDADAQILRAFASGVGGNLHLAFDGTSTGTVRAEVKTVGTDPATGRFAEIELAIDVVLRADRSRFVEARRLETEGEEGIETLGADLNVALKGGATIRWGVDSGRPLESIILCDETVAMSVRVLPPEGDPVEQTMRMQGGMAHRLVFKTLPRVPVRRTEGR